MRQKEREEAGKEKRLRKTKDDRNESKGEDGDGGRLITREKRAGVDVTRGREMEW